MLRHLSCFILLQILFTGVIAQEYILSGTVSQEGTKLPLTGVNIKIKGGVTVTQSDSKGDFKLIIPDSEAQIVVSYVGYVTQEIKPGKAEYINIVLRSEQTNLNEVIVVAYGTVKKENFTGSASTVKSETFENRPITSFEKALQGAVAGVQVTSVSGQPGSTSSVRIRGVGSLSGSSTPLYVLDGVAITNGNMSYMGQTLEVTNTADVLSMLNPNDIESVTVLKDASAAAIYGSRAANGVILINTKKGKSGKTQFSATSSGGYSYQAVPKHDILNGSEYYKLFWDNYYSQKIKAGNTSTDAVTAANELTNTKLFGSKTKNNYNTISPFTAKDVLAPGAALYYDTDWRDAVLRKGITKDINVSAQGGTDKIKYFVGGGYFDQKGIVIGSDFKRYSGRVNFSNNVSDKFSLGINNSLSYSDQNTPPGAGGAANPVRFADLVSNIYPLYVMDANGAFVLNASGNKTYSYVNSVTPDYNPLGLAELDEYNTRTARVISNPYAELKFLKDFKVRTSVGVDYITNRERQFYNTLHGNAAIIGRGYRYSREDITLTFINTLSYNKSLGDHLIDVLVGQEAFKSRLDNNYSQATNFAFPGVDELISASTPTIARSFYTEKRFESYFSRVNYSFENKYFLSASFRRDGSSTFGTSNQFGNFYSVGGAWRLMKERFFQNVSFLNELKLKASFGKSGNDKINTDNNRALDGRYASQSLYSLGKNYEGEGGMSYTQLGNPDLGWEKNTSIDVGLEFAAVNNRLSGEFSYYNRGSDGLLYFKQLSRITGFEGINTNFASMDNYGFELLLNAQPFKGKKLDWNISFNYARNTNRIRKIGNAEYLDNSAKRWREGINRYQWYIRDYAGVDPADGKPLWYKDEIGVDGKPKRTTTSTWGTATLYDNLGSSLPKYTGGFNSTLKYQQFDFNLFAYFSVGNKIYDGLYALLMHNGSSIGQQLSTDVLKAWQKEGDITSVPRFEISNTDLGNNTSSRFLFDGSYIRVKNISLGYTLPKKQVQPVGLSSARIYLMAENLFTIARHKGMDPEVEITGVNNNDVPNIKTISLGINIGL